MYKPLDYFLSGKKFWGKVKKDNQRGKQLGFPTANISLHKNISEGIYISKTKIGKLIFNSITFVGVAKTFEEKRFHAESYILDFNKSIYGEWISVQLLKKIRNNKKFTSAQELIKQMEEDEKKTRKYFENELLFNTK